MRRFALLYTFALLLALPLGGLVAQTVELLPFTGSQSGTEEQTARLTQGCMDALFDAGYIAADARPAVLQKAEWNNAALGVRKAEDGFADFVLCFYVEWKPSAAVSGMILPASIRYRAVKVGSVKTVCEGELAVPPDDPDSVKKLDKALGLLGAQIAKAFIGASKGDNP